MKGMRNRNKTGTTKGLVDPDKDGVKKDKLTPGDGLDGSRGGGGTREMQAKSLGWAWVTSDHV